MTLRFTAQGKTFVHRTPFVFVGNNAYRTEGLQIGQRDDLRAGVLNVYAAEPAGRWRLALGLSALVGRLRQASDFREVLVGDLCIDTSHHSGIVAPVYAFKLKVRRLVRSPLFIGGLVTAALAACYAATWRAKPGMAAARCDSGGRIVNGLQPAQKVAIESPPGNRLSRQWQMVKAASMPGWMTMRRAWAPPFPTTRFFRLRRCSSL